MNDPQTTERLLSRFVRYASMDSQSDLSRADAGIFPSTESQKTMASALKADLIALGLADVALDANYYLTARIPASPGLEGKPSFGLSAHYDTAGDAPASGVKPVIHRNWDGKPISLQEGFSLDPRNDEALAACVGQTLVTSDGTTLLGADDKAGVAAIITLAELLLMSPEIKHGPIELMFSPDEETGHGMDRAPIERLRSKAFYTIDGGREGELEIECFNAWKVELTFTGVSAHLGAARGKMVNAVLMAAAFISSLPSQESPEATDGYYGYFCPLEMHGEAEKASVLVFIRDFDEANMLRRLERIDTLAKATEARYPGGSVSVKKTRQYGNMRQKLDERPEVVNLLKQAYEIHGIEPIMNPIRGGTDGARLTELGIPTPNVFTGARNLHSRTEWVSIDQTAKAVGVLVELAKLWGAYSDV